MNDAVKILRDIGAQTIHNETHISREYVQAIIHETFDGLQSVQFMGFLSILEREYNIDLSDLREKGKLHFKEEIEKLQKSEKVFVSAAKKTSYAKVYIVLAIALFVSFIYISSIAPELDQVETTEIIKAEEVAPIEQKIEENNITVVATEIEETLTEAIEVNTTVEKVVEEPVVEEIIEVEPEIVVVKTLKILPKRKIWAGYINIKTNQKYQKVFRKEFALDISKDWLLLFGSGTVYLEVNGEKVKFSSKQNMRFKYVDGAFTKITLTEFKSLNKGRKW